VGPMNGVEAAEEPTDLAERVRRLEQAIDALQRLERRAEFDEWRRRHRPAG
jgi:hypothetical protein